jgi:histidine ammonia-lyase
MMQAGEPVVIGQPLSIEAVVRVARDGAPVQLSEAARQRVRHSRRYVEHLLAENRVVYGVTTGLGKLVHQRISAHETRALQRNLLLSHAMGVGEPFPHRDCAGDDAAACPEPRVGVQRCA